MVSVVIPAYNAALYLADALRSVMAQTYRDYEIIVVNDGSTDTTREVLEEFQPWIRHLSQANQGPSAARNLGIRAARGTYICFLDADDLWTPDKLQVQVEFLENHPEIGLVFADIEEFGTFRSSCRSVIRESFGSEVKGGIAIPDAFSKLLTTNFIPTPTVMVRSHCLLRSGVFNESLRIVEDRDLWLRIAAHFQIAWIPQVLCRRRVHDCNLSQNDELALHSRLKVVSALHQECPDQAPASVWKEELSRLYLQLATSLLVKNRGHEGRQALLHSLHYRIRLRALALFLLSFLGRPVIDSLRWLGRKWFFSRT